MKIWYVIGFFEDDDEYVVIPCDTKMIALNTLARQEMRFPGINWIIAKNYFMNLRNKVNV